MKPDTFQFRVTFDENGEISQEDEQRYDALVSEVYNINQVNKRFYANRKYTVRKRYFGPRAHRVDRSEYNRQSMCVKADARGFRVYVYAED